MCLDLRSAVYNLLRLCRETHLQKKIKAQLLDAKAKSQAKDKKGALFALKRKKMYEGEINKINGARMTLEQQVSPMQLWCLAVSFMTSAMRFAVVM